MKSHSERTKGIVAIVLLAVIYGLLPLIPRYLNTSFQLFQQLYLRVFVAFLFSYVLFHKRIDVGKIKKLPAQEWALIIGRAAIYYLIGVALYTQAILMTKISNVVLIGAIPSTAILGFMILKEKVTSRKLSLVLLSAIGVYILSVKDFSNLFVFGLGETIALASAFCVSLGLISRRWHSKALNDQEISTLVLLFSGILIFIASIVKGEGLPLNNWSIGVMLAIIVGGLLNTGVSFFMNYGVSRIDAVLTGNILATEPVFAAIFAFLIFREIPLPKEFLGGLLIAGSAVLMNQVEQK